MSGLEVDKSIKPESNCKVCKGSGEMLYKNGKIVCECIIKKHARKYLGLLYDGVPYSNNIKFDKLLNKNKHICFYGCSTECFKSMVKSFLLYHNMRLTHKHIFPNYLVDDYFDDKFGKSLKDLSEVDFLTIYFINDPTNRMYGELIEIILDRRILYKKPTWLYMKADYRGDWFKDKYSISLSEYISKNFERMLEVNKLTFKKGLSDE